MIRRHIVESGLIALCVILTAIVLMMWWASQYAHFITTAMMIMIILGLMDRELSTKYYFNLACNRPNNDW